MLCLTFCRAFIPLRPSSGNFTDWTEIVKEFGKNKGEDALSMVLSILSLLGMINLVFYTGFGLSSWPIGLIRGTKSARAQHEEIQNKHIVVQTRINALKDKLRLTNKLTNREKRLLASLEEEERNMNREERLVAEHRQSWKYKIRSITRPMEITLGLSAAVLGVLLWISLLLTK